MATQCFGVDEVVYGTDGDAKTGIGPAIDEAKDRAKDDGSERMEVEIRVKPRGSGVSSQADPPFRVDTSMATSTIASQIRKKLGDNPGDTFSGQVLITFRKPTDASLRFKTYTRTMRMPVPQGGDEGTDEATTDKAVVREIIHGAVAPLVDQIVRLAEVGIERDKASAQLVSANAQVTAGFAHMLKPENGVERGGGDGNLLLKMLGGALGANSGTNNMPGGPAGRAAAGAAGALVRSGGEPPPAPIARPKVAPPPRLPGVPGVPPAVPGSLVSPRTGISRRDVDQWAKDHPQEAEDMVRSALRARGFPA